MQSDPASRPIIRVSVYTDRLPLAEHSGLIFDRISKAFNALDEVRALPRRERPQLRLVNVEVGSLFADFMVIGSVLGTVVAVVDFAVLARTFISRLRKAALVMAGKETGSPSKAERAAVNALALPVANDGARQVNVQIVGDNNVVNFVEMTPELWREIQTQRAIETGRLRIVAASGSAAGVGGAGGVGETVHHLRAKGVVAQPPSIGTPTIQVHDAVSQTSTSTPRLEDIPVGSSPTVKGRAQWIDTDWFVLPEGNDTFWPVRNETIMQGRSKSGNYPVEGRLVSHAGTPIGFRVIVIGEPSDG